MFGQIGQIAGLLRNAGKLRESMGDMQQRLAAARFVGESGAGQVRATVDGKGELISLKIDPALVQSGDVEMLEDLTSAAVRDAVNRSREAVQKELQGALGGMDLGGMMDLLGGGPK
ncbi:MAG: YbaB/EbfC family nucleoid-associated protein [Phycisphaerae bacterium]